jgi:3,4-dihydroxy 2-butanone 4-phosphate synthase/GTP cyclohydrolase II
MFILVDHEDRENEGDLVIPAQWATPDAINFMATHGRGLICLSMTSARIEQLGLPLMSTNNSSRHETAFTTSIEAREGVTTGISAADRARTVQVAIDASKGAQDIATPGHVFPLRARDGGVLVRAGHTEAAVDISRLAGLNPSGVICEIMNEDGSMARLPDLIAVRAAARAEDRDDLGPDFLPAAARQPREGAAGAGDRERVRRHLDLCASTPTRPKAPSISCW